MVERSGRSKVRDDNLTSSDCSPEEFDLRLAALLQLAGESEIASRQFFNFTGANSHYLHQI